MVQGIIPTVNTPADNKQPISPIIICPADRFAVIRTDNVIGRIKTLISSKAPSTQPKPIADWGLT